MMRIPWDQGDHKKYFPSGFNWIGG